MHSPPQRKVRRRRRKSPSRRTRLILVALREAIWVIAVAFGLGMLLRYAWGEWPFVRPVQKATHRHLTMAEARAYNASVPVALRTIPAAAPFAFHGTPAARLQAAECLATAAIYEAGDDVVGQRAIMQVILNRVRAPGFPGTVCGVVYQGSALKTGCQFSFACDGSLQRRPEHEGWEAARLRARHALSGSVFHAVGTATNYHADWMVPYWMPTLDKVATIDTHIFYIRHHGPPRPLPPDGDGADRANRGE